MVMDLMNDLISLISSLIVVIDYAGFSSDLLECLYRYGNFRETPSCVGRHS